MKKMIATMILAACLLSCEKKNEPVLTDCQQNNVGYITFENQSKHTFEVWINNVLYKQQPGNSVIKKQTFNAGKAYKIYVKQAAGYVFYPTEKTFNITLNQCDEQTITFTN